MYFKKHIWFWFIMILPFLLSGQIFSYSLDPALIMGFDKDNGEMLNSHIRIGYNAKHYEFHLFYDEVKPLSFYGYGLMIYRQSSLKKFQFLYGPELLIIERNIKDYIAYGLNLETRYYFYKKWGLFYQVNIRRRTELKHFRLSAYLGLIINMER